MNRILRKAESGEPVTYKEAKELYANVSPWDLFQTARYIASENHGKKISFYKNAFPPISITGNTCSLNCDHCGGHYLKHMLSAPTENMLKQVCTSLNEKKVPGIVLSGGNNGSGTVPLVDFADAIRAIKSQADLTIIGHTGPINEGQAKILAKAGLDGALIDIVGDAKTTKKVFGIEIHPKRYAIALKGIANSGVPNISPHIIIGLDYGKIVGEIKALKLLSEVPLDNIVFVVLIPTKGTNMNDVKPPSPIEIGKLVAIGQLMYPLVPIALGCVRPGGNYRNVIDEFALQAGISKLAIPTSRARETAESLKLKIKEFEQMCCAWM